MVEPTVEVMTLEPEVISETIAEVVMAEDDPAPAPVSVAVDVPVAEVTRVVSVVVVTPRRCQTRNQTMELSCVLPDPPGDDPPAEDPPEVWARARAEEQ